MGPSWSLTEDELGGGAGNTTGFEEEPMSVVTDNTDTDMGVLRGGPDGRGSMACPDAVVPVSESTRESVAVVSIKRRGSWVRRNLLMVEQERREALRRNRLPRV